MWVGLGRFGGFGARLVASVTVIAALGLTGATLSGADTGPTASTVSVERPPGQLVIDQMSVDAQGHIDVVVVDTRPDDPGWSVQMTVDATPVDHPVRVIPSVREQSRAFTDSAGRTYAQQVEVPDHLRGVGRVSGVLGSAPAGHGLGVAHLRGVVTGDPHHVRVSVTIV